jgi:hypothetical protein
MSDDIEDVVVRLRRTRADMIGTDDEEHYFDCHEAAHVIEELRDEITNLNELAKDRYCTMQTKIERLRGDIQVLKLQRDATHVSRCPNCNNGE